VTGSRFTIINNSMLLQTRQTLETLIEVSPLAIITLDPQARVQLWNAAAEQMFGWNEAEAVERTLPFADAHNSEELQQLHEIVFQGISFTVGELAVRTRDDRPLYVSVSAAPVPDDSGEIGLVMAIITDITQRKRDEIALRHSEARSRAIIDNSISGLILADAHGRIELLNPAAELMFGYTQAELVGQPLMILLSAKDDEARTASFEKLRRDALRKVTEHEGRRRGGEVFPLELGFYQFATESGNQLVWNVRDLSERQEVEKLKKEFISTVSHELRTPLTSIRGSLTLIASGAMGAVAPEAQELLAVANRNTIRLIALINDILDLEKLESGKLEMQISAQSLLPAIERAHESVKSFADQNQIRLEIAPTEAQVLMDSDRIVQVLVNLLSNAVKFSSSGSAVKITVEPLEREFEVCVTDQGRGIPAQHLGKLFERFRQVEASDDRQKGGTGLGLAICRNIIEQHGGTIGVISEEGKGSTFWFRLLRAENDH
jgi:PAS domain S-box-containing protein